MSGAWLALDTATALASVAVGEPPEARSTTLLEGPRTHAGGIVELIDRTVRASGLAVADLAGIVVSDGPGSFTGLRIGWAAAKGLAQERELPLVAIPALAAAAASAAAVLGPVPIAACFDALRGQVFGAVYVLRPERLEVVVAPGLWTPEELIAATPERPRAAVGDGAVRYGAALEPWTGARTLDLRALRPTGASLLALQPLAGVGRRIEDPASAEPDYGRPAEAQARWEARHGRPLSHPTRSGS
ncbi:MAG TPA: tRNA (adenosine(37)-N6)-threonylcarbamoyltransferase complex dimerization subunit type 1 TsaB [Gemmatimonadales bacterium]|nr:tRNA (adenosine(37)-N6)-threonylcarbamoyltransferase complex dimerization subunit type 1 TsaB [Gemmatimonadales bacterium]